MSNVSPSENRSNGKDRSETVRECAIKMKEEVGRIGEIAKDATQEKLGELQKEGEKQLERVAEYARSRPLTSILAAAVIGYLGASFLKRV